MAIYKRMYLKFKLQLNNVYTYSNLMKRIVKDISFNYYIYFHILVYIIYIIQSYIRKANVKIKRNYTLLLYKYSSSFALLNPVGKLKLIRLFDKNIL